jgi:GNAT superfamily N-acetyltransferase
MSDVITIPSFLPGALALAPGTPQDYLALARFHYLPGRPATWAGVWAVRYDARLIAVAVLSYPTVNSAARDRALRLDDWPAARKLAFVNRHVRAISRVVVHPQFRGVGLAARLVRHACDTCPTRFVEAVARMGRVHPFFEKGGMRAATIAEDPDAPVYYIFDRRRSFSRRLG